MRFALIALVFTFVGFVGFYFAFKMGLRSKNEAEPARHASKVSRSGASGKPLLLSQLDELDTHLLNNDFKRASRLLMRIDELTPRYKSEWQTAIDRKDVEQANKIRNVIEDLRVALS